MRIHSLISSAAMPWLAMGDRFVTKYTKGTGKVYQELKAELQKVPTDHRNYTLIKLKNMMEVLVGRDTRYPKAMVVMDVNVGFRHEPRGLVGLAHLCEHMVHLGSETYPEPVTYGSFVEKNAGFYNAETGYENTVYRFMVDKRALDTALDMFSDMLRAPLFNQSLLESELRVMGEEFNDNLQNDDYRLRMVARVAGALNHTYPGHFGGNNLTLLGIGPEALREELVKFHATRYSPNRMRLVVIGEEDLEDQIERIVTKFGSFNNIDFQPQPEGEPFLPNPLPKQLVTTAATVQSTYRLRLTFKLPTMFQYHSIKPESYIGYLLCQSGQGSILALVKKKGWAFDIICGVAEGYSDFSMFDLKFQLTPLGVQHVPPMIEMVFQAINLFKKEGVTLAIFDELKVLSLMQWIFLQREDPLTHTRRVAFLMHRSNPPRRTLNSELLFDYSPDCILQVLDLFQLNNLRVMLSHKRAKVNMTEPIYGTGYSVREIGKLKGPAELGLNPELSLPPKNRFAVTSFIPGSSDLNVKYPLKIITNENGELWGLKARSNSPKSIAFLSVASSQKASLESAAKLELLAKLVMEGLDEINFQLMMAGYEYSVEPTHSGLLITAQGFQQKLGTLLEEVVAKIIDSRIDRLAFSMFKHEEVSRLMNLDMDFPSEQAVRALSYALGQTRWRPLELIEATENITHSDITSFVKAFFRKGCMLLYIHGNINSTEAIDIYRNTTRQLRSTNIIPVPYSASYNQIPSSFVPGTPYVHRYQIQDPHEVNSGLAMYIHTFDEAQPRREALTRLLLFLLEEIFFYQARLMEQLGYQQRVGIREESNGGGLEIVLQSGLDPATAELSVENILMNLKKHIETMAPPEFQTRARSFINYATQRKRDDKEAGIYWSQIQRQSNLFQKDRHMGLIYPNLTQLELLDFMDDSILYRTPNRMKLSIHTVSQTIANLGYHSQNLQNCGDRILDLGKWRDMDSLPEEDASP